MITLFFIIVFAIILLFLQKSKIAPIISFDKDQRNIKINFLGGLVLVFMILFLLFNPISFERINSGSIGLKENLTGSDRGVSGVTLVSGYQFYNSITTNIHEIELDQKNVHYDSIPIIVKGGFGCVIKPTFNYKVKPDAAGLLFVELRQTFKNGGLKAIESSWLETAILGAINDVSNRYEVDSIFNNREGFENQISIEVQKRVGKYFQITLFKSNIIPPESLRESIETKTKAIQEAQGLELKALTAIAGAKEKVAIAQGNFDAAVLDAKAKDLLSQPKMLDLFKAETDRIRAQKGISEYGTNNVFGGNPGLFLNRN